MGVCVEAGCTPASVDAAPALALSAAISASGRTSASIPRRPDFERSWLRRSRTVSRFASTSSVPPLMKPATSTPPNAVTSIFGDRGVSIGTSKKLVHALVNVSRTRLAIVAALRAVIDFLEQIVVLSNQDVLRIECDGFFVRLARVLESPFVLVSNPQVVPGSRVSGIGFRGLLPAVHGFFPEAVLRDLDAEVHLRLRARSCV